MHDKINVCLLNDSFPPVIDGVANAVVNYGEIISTKNLGKATVVTPEYPGAVDGYPFDVVRYPSLSTEQLVGYRAGVPFDAKIFGKLEKAGFNIIHTHCPVVSTLMARTLREKLDIPVVFTYHTKFDVNICDMVRSKLIQEAALHNLCANIQSCDEVWVVSRGAGENLRGIGYEGEYIVMENGVDFPKGRVAPEEAVEVRREYGIGQDERVFMYVGRMMWYKGIRITLDGLKKAKEEGFAFKMIFVGDGADRSEMEKYAKELGLEKECIFPGAIRDRELLRRYFCAADMFLFPSTFDTNGIVVREAAACGLPSVLVKGSCAAEGTTHLQNAYLIEENADSMAEAVKFACREAEAVKNMGGAAMDELYISWEESVRRAVDRYGVVIDNYKKGNTERDRIWTDPFFAMMAEVQTRMNAAYERRVSLEQRSREIYGKAEEMGREAMEKGREMYDRAWERLERYL